MGQGSPREVLPKASRGPQSSLRSRSKSPTSAAASVPTTTATKIAVVPPHMSPPPMRDRPASVLLPRRRGITFGEAPRLQSPTPPRPAALEPRMKAQLTPRPILRPPAPNGFARRNHAQSEAARGSARGSNNRSRSKRRIRGSIKSESSRSGYQRGSKQDTWTAQGRAKAKARTKLRVADPQRDRHRQCSR